MNNALIESDIAGVPVVLDDEPEDAEQQVYEVGYHLLSTVAEDAVSGEVASIMAILTKADAEPIADKAPVLIDLAYTLDKKIDGVRRSFDRAYFGWVAFALPAGALHEVKTALDHHAAILRYLIVKTTRETVAANLADPHIDISTKVLREVEVGGEVSEAALDTALKQIEAEDVKTEEKT